MANVWGEAGGEEENTSLQMQPQPNFQPGNTKLQTNARLVSSREVKPKMVLQLFIIHIYLSQMLNNTTWLYCRTQGGPA